MNDTLIKKVGIKMSPSGLDLIAQEYQRALQQPKKEKNKTLVSLMNQLEKSMLHLLLTPLKMNLIDKQFSYIKRLAMLVIFN